MKKFITSLALNAGKSLKYNFSRAIQKKKKDKYGDIVTNADYAAEKIIISQIKKYYPEDNILSEEAGYFKKKSDYTWIIDPLDGTKNFAASVPLFGTTIARAYKNKIIHGVIYDPIHQELFYAEKDKGAFLNDKKIKVNNKKHLQHFMGGVANVRSVTDTSAYNKIKNEMYSISSGWRVLGTAVLDLAWVACGRMDLFILGGVCPWDVAAGGLLIEEAGGIMCELNGNKWEPFKKRQEIIACPSNQMKNEILKIIK